MLAHLKIKQNINIICHKTVIYESLRPLDRTHIWGFFVSPNKAFLRLPFYQLFVDIAVLTPNGTDDRNTSFDQTCGGGNLTRRLPNPTAGSRETAGSMLVDPSTIHMDNRAARPAAQGPTREGALDRQVCAAIEQISCQVQA